MFLLTTQINNLNWTKFGVSEKNIVDSFLREGVLQKVYGQITDKPPYLTLHLVTSIYIITKKSEELIWNNICFKEEEEERDDYS